MFYQLDQAGRPHRWLDFDDYIAKGYKKIKWFRGHIFTDPVPDPLKLVLLPLSESDGHGQFLPAFISQCSSLILIRDDLIDALEAFGVDNFDKYNVTMTDPDNGEVYTNYKAVNIIGVVAAADLNKSQYEIGDGIALVDVAFDKLVLKEDAVEGLLMFRLAENLMTILVHESVREYLLKLGFINGSNDDDIEFYKLGEAAIL